MILMKLKEILLMIVILNLGTLAGQKCTWTIDYDKLYVSDVKSTDNSDVLVASVNDKQKNRRNGG